jgi:hypothetical protein
LINKAFTADGVSPGSDRKSGCRRFNSAPPGTNQINHLAKSIPSEKRPVVLVLYLFRKKSPAVPSLWPLSSVESVSVSIRHRNVRKPTILDLAVFFAASRVRVSWIRHPRRNHLYSKLPSGRWQADKRRENTRSQTFKKRYLHHIPLPRLETKCYFFLPVLAGVILWIRPSMSDTT